MMNFPMAVVFIISSEKMLRIQITKRRDGSGVLRCVRADGSFTWQKQERQAAFFALHDLTHFAVESTLGFRQGFYGLIEAGWDIEDTTGLGVRGPLPGEALEVEYFVGSLDAERASGSTWTADQFNEHAAIHSAASGRIRPRLLSGDDLARVRARRGELFRDWSAVQAGGILELRFELGGC
jgi:hypothetical protein